MEPRRSAGLAELIDNLERAVGAGRIVARDPLEMALALWSAVHGLTSLVVVNPDLPAAFAHLILELASAALLDGLALAPD